MAKGDNTLFRASMVEEDSEEKEGESKLNC
jgi:hypothetical protein